MSTMDHYKQALVLVHMTCKDRDCGGPEDVRHMGRAYRLVELLKDRAFVKEWLDGGQPAAPKYDPALEKTMLGARTEMARRGVEYHDHECTLCQRAFGPCSCEFAEMPRRCPECDDPGGFIDDLLEKALNE